MRKYKIYNNERGVSAVLIAILLVVLMGFAALAFDLSHIFVAQNELQNAADAGALAGTRFLYNDYGTEVNVGANQIAFDAAVANISENVPVEVNWTEGNTGDVLRGHWSFATKTFTANASTVAVPLWDVSEEELDVNTDFINAVQVTTRREATPISAYFARIFGIENFQRTATAVAYIGFAGTSAKGEFDQPIAICKQSITEADGIYSGCNIGRMLNSGPDAETNNTAAWSNFSQPCETATPPEMRTLICNQEGSNPDTVNFGTGMGAVGGVQDNVFRDLRDCWINSDSTPNVDGLPDDPWKLKLPVIDCPGNNVSNCPRVVGVVTLNVIFISPEGGTPDINDAPSKMGDWTFSETDFNLDTITDAQDRWDEFVDHFKLRNVEDGTVAPYSKKSIYFLPTCEGEERVGSSDGENFGVLAKYPKLVK